MHACKYTWPCELDLSEYYNANVDQHAIDSVESIAWTRIKRSLQVEVREWKGAIGLSKACISRNSGRIIKFRINQYFTFSNMSVICTFQSMLESHA